MVKLTKIYTRTGDGGTTGLVDGSRVAKDAAVMQAIGDVDEANSALGVAIAALGEHDSAATLLTIQNDLFDLGADLSRPDMAADDTAGHPVLRIIQPQVDRLEAEIDGMNADLSPLRSFILPGGSALAAHLHVARTVARRAERRAIELAAAGDANPAAIRYLNRLSDWLFVAARVANADAGGDILWVPGASR